VAVHLHHAQLHGFVISSSRARAPSALVKRLPQTQAAAADQLPRISRGSTGAAPRRLAVSDPQGVIATGLERSKVTGVDQAVAVSRSGARARGPSASSSAAAA